MLGLYRRLEPRSEKRYVISSPPETFEILEEDQVFALKRANFEYPPGSRMQTAKKKNKAPRTATVLEEKLQDLGADVTVMEERYENLIRAELHARNSVTGMEEEPAENQTLLGSNKPFSDQLSQQLAQDKRLLGEELLVMENKLASIKQDVAAMQELYGRSNASVRKYRRYEPTKFVNSRRSTEL